MNQDVPLFFVAYQIGVRNDESGEFRRPLSLVKARSVTDAAEHIAKAFAIPLDAVLLVPVPEAPTADIVRLSAILASEFYIMQFALAGQAQARVQPVGSHRLVT